VRSERRILAGALAALAVVGSLAVAGSARADDVDLSSYFRLGVEAYQHGQVAEAIRYWEAVYTQAGPRRGYRVAFNLARAYAVFGDTTQSAQHYEAFLTEVDAQRKANATLDPTVEKESGEARVELEGLKAKSGRLHVAAVTPPVAVSIDGASARVAGFTVYVTPGAHRVVFAPGTASETVRTVNLQAGEVAEAEPPPPAPAPTPPITPPPAMTPTTGPKTDATPAPGHHTEHPFSPAFLVVAGGATLVSSLVPILTYKNARGDRNDALAVQNDKTAYATAMDQYNSARTTAYATLAVPLGLGVVTLGLTTWYLAGGRQVEDPHPAASKRGAPAVLPTFTPTPGGATFGAVGTF
jgi:hypothetical protein